MHSIKMKHCSLHIFTNYNKLSYIVLMQRDYVPGYLSLLLQQQKLHSKKMKE
jgi:hypothetical protein